MYHYCFFFFFKQKTAYEMRISDWSSDVCSSDLGLLRQLGCQRLALALGLALHLVLRLLQRLVRRGLSRGPHLLVLGENGGGLVLQGRGLLQVVVEIGRAHV